MVSGSDFSDHEVHRVPPGIRKIGSRGRTCPTLDQYYLNRYVHSERDTQKRVLRHLDGAVKVYLPDNYSDRFNSNIPTEAKSHVKIKLFRVDGNIVVDDWIELISFFFKSNEMIIEYFNPEQFKTMFEERVRDYKTWKQKQQGETV